MTPEELKNIVRYVFHFYDANAEDSNWTDMNEACGQIIKILEQEPCEDAVSRIEVDRLCNMYLRVPTDQHVAFYEHFVDLPPVTPARETGKWIEGSTEQGALGIRYTEKTCSKCGWSHSLIIPQNYCPKCGTEMRGSK